MNVRVPVAEEWASDLGVKEWSKCHSVKEWSKCHSAQLKVCMISAVDTKLDQTGMGTARFQPSVIVREGRQLSDVYDRQKNNPSGGITDRSKRKKKEKEKKKKH